MKVVVVTFPGSNCDYDGYHAFKLVGADVSFRWHRESDLSGVDLVFLPGGFAYGDYLRAGAIARFSPIMESVARFAADGGPVIGVCNGFQVLCEAGLLPGALSRNAGRRFLGKDVHIRTERSDTSFTADYSTGQILRIPVAHGEGCYYADADTLDRLEQNGQVLFRYCDAAGNVTDAANPNGSSRNIAGIMNERGNVMGMMPHPERAVEEVMGGTDGVALFTSLLGSALNTLQPAS